MVSVKVYVVVMVGDTDGLLTAEVKPAGFEVQLYVYPAVEAEPITADPPLQIVDEAPALTTGRGLTVMVMLLELVQPVAVIVSTNV